MTIKAKPVSQLSVQFFFIFSLDIFLLFIISVFIVFTLLYVSFLENDTEIALGFAQQHVLYLEQFVISLINIRMLYMNRSILINIVDAK